MTTRVTYTHANRSSMSFHMNHNEVTTWRYKLLFSSYPTFVTTISCYLHTQYHQTHKQTHCTPTLFIDIFPHKPQWSNDKDVKRHKIVIFIISNFRGNAFLITYVHNITKHICKYIVVSLELILHLEHTPIPKNDILSIFANDIVKTKQTAGSADLRPANSARQILLRKIRRAKYAKHALCWDPFLLPLYIIQYINTTGLWSVTYGSTS
jgi:hypothetical protein